MKYYLFLFLSLCMFSLQAKIVEIDSFSTILEEVDQETLVLVDIDETLLTALDCLGNSSWWKYYKAKLKSHHVSDKDPFWLKITRLILDQMSIMPIEKEAASIIQALQKKGILVLGLTARPLKAPWDNNHSIKTSLQLRSIDVDFTKSQIPQGVHLHKAPDHHAFNIIFTTWQMKGPVLINVYKKIGLHPKKVIMIDDQYPQLLSLDESHEKLNLPFIGFHYTRCARQSRAFDPMIGNIQLKELITKKYLPSYDEALQIKQALLEQNPDLSLDFFLEELLIGLLQVN